MLRENYTYALFKLLPPGIVFSREKGSGSFTLFDTLAQSIYELYNSATGLIKEANPLTMTTAIPSRFTEAGLPDLCTGTPTTSQEKRAQVVGRWSQLGGATKQYFLDVLTRYGYQVKIWEYYKTMPVFRIGQTGIGTSGFGVEFTRCWKVHFVDTTTTYFRAGESSAGEYLNSNQNQSISCILDRIKPAHTLVIYNPVATQSEFDALPSS